MFPVLFLFLILKYPVFSLAETAKRKLFLGANCALFHHPSQRWWLLRVVDELIQTCMRKSQVLCPYEEDQSVYFKCFKISQTDDFPNLGLILLPRGPHRPTWIIHRNVILIYIILPKSAGAMGQGRKAICCHLHQVSAYLPHQLVYHPSHFGMKDDRLISVLPQPTGNCGRCSGDNLPGSQRRAMPGALCKTCLSRNIVLFLTSCLGVRMLGGPGLTPRSGRNPWRHKELSGEPVPGE